MAAGEYIKEEVKEKVDLIHDYGHRLVEWLINFLPDLAAGILTLIFGLWLIKRIAKLAEKAMERRHLEVSLRTFLKSLIAIGLKVVLLVMVAGMIGIQTTSFVAILGAAGLAIGLALQGSLSNFAGGVLILIFKPYKVGDTIETSGQKGEVKEIQIFNTILLTPDYRTIILPNGAVSNAYIINYTRQGDLRIDIDIPIHEKHALEAVRDLFLPVIKQFETIHTEPGPSVTCASFIPGGFTVHVKAFAKSGMKADVQAALMEALLEVMRKEKIESAPVPPKA